ncbi:MAG: 3-deoxy-7-phosphoheptulonate synthase [Deltaproteobacteria bacterium]|nr:3-deoxy-7-phosphoheptulonate synthase [Deltaproteobacteria bacterium]
MRDCVLLLESDADRAEVDRALRRLGVWSVALGDGTALQVASHSQAVDDRTLASLPGVAKVMMARSEHPLLDAQAGVAVTLGQARGASAPVRCGPGAEPLLLAGPCSAESEETAWQAAAMAAAAGAKVLRGGAFKPRTSPYAYRGDGATALRWLREAADAHGLLLVSEAMSEAHAAEVAEYADVVQVGSRSMASYGLLSAIGTLGRPVLLKRGQSATLQEWRLAAEHLLAAGAAGVVLCERGIAGVDRETRNVLDLGAVALIAGIDGHAIVVDPSHAAGRRDLVVPLAQAGLSAGAHGVLVEAHPDAGNARSDAAQAIDAATLQAIGASVRKAAQREDG